MAQQTSRCASPGISKGGSRAHRGLGDAPHCLTLPTPRDLAKGGKVEYTNEKHTLELAPNSTERRQLAQLLEGRPDQSV